MEEIKFERFSEQVQRWDESQWNAKEWRQYLFSVLRDGEKALDKVSELEPLCESQGKYIKYLERQLELLQKTLDIAEKFTRPIVLPGDGGGIK